MKRYYLLLTGDLDMLSYEDNEDLRKKAEETFFYTLKGHLKYLELQKESFIKDYEMMYCEAHKKMNPNKDAKGKFVSRITLDVQLCEDDKISTKFKNDLVRAFQVMKSFTTHPIDIATNIYPLINMLIVENQEKVEVKKAMVYNMSTLEENVFKKYLEYISKEK